MFLQHPALIVIIPLIAAVITPVLGLWKKVLCYYWVVFTLALTTLVSIDTLFSVLRDGTLHYQLGGWPAPFGIELVIDHLNGMMLVLITGISFLVSIYSYRTVESELPGKIDFFYSIFLLQVTGFLGIVITGDLFNLYVFLEIAALAGYALIAIGEDGAPWACFRYIVMGTIGASFYLLGVGYIYITTGSLNMADVHVLLQDLQGSKVMTAAVAFLITGLALKMALFPLHFWLPDAYTKAPSASSALIAPLMTKIALYVMIRVLFDVFGSSWSIGMVPLTTLLTWTGVVAIFGGAIMALAQTDFKRLLCYVVVAEVGYIAGGMGLANEPGMKGAILHILNDAVMTVGLFAVAGIIMQRARSHNLSDFRDLFPKMPLTMTALVIIGLSIIGVPPTCGFFSKWYLIQGAVLAGQWAFIAALLFSSLVSVILFFRIFEIGYGFKSEEHAHAHDSGSSSSIQEAPFSMLFPTLAIAIAILIIGFYNQTIVSNIINLAVPKL
jgi:multicomponent Na+:H+ antiporter subunit D